MKILLATNFLKGSLSAIETANCLKKGILSVDNKTEIEIIPIADGGDGTIEAIKYCSDYTEIVSIVCGPLEQEVAAKWLILNINNEKVAIIEGAQANGLSILRPDEYNPLKATSYGIGQLVLSALEHECSKIYVTIGGSATNDCGIGIIQALGGKFLDKDSEEIKKGGEGLENLESIDLTGLDKRLNTTKLIVACDVDNPLCGPNGASAVYGPQKGATPELVEYLDKNLSHVADLVAENINNDLRDYPGVGAAGGIGFAFKAILNATLTPGFDLVAELSSMKKKIKSADIVITSEGRLDSQSLSGKAPYQIAKLANEHNIPTIVIAGSVEKKLDLSYTNIKAALSITDGPLSLEEARKNASYLGENCGRQIMNLFIL
ncbi:MAG: glycerate kinase [Vampirovibrionia bacterium]